MYFSFQKQTNYFDGCDPLEYLTQLHTADYSGIPSPIPGPNKFADEMREIYSRIPDHIMYNWIMQTSGQSTCETPQEPPKKKKTVRTCPFFFLYGIC